mmetsp:Transcript_21708/g.60371  ORF Transcript_21708/g.60371 Transcript_21708/m.60371 type:complete len:236 (+) Transcript_21708:240-947(+)|eukprot:CAMPEP_0117657946 /NCGR_PEP_ID=MMETSP0804-20121206/5600_1 /TAXON_ID=1074897 /ORGANISM="Tetraselmis astigmatica, Strain CCMP880" /LENGTH=235 /DNA_ID=CAMNT_0005464431 /DNA_START=150 /DNA_END=857 /DNA_ORIENTATION=+
MFAVSPLVAKATRSQLVGKLATSIPPPTAFRNIGVSKLSSSAPEASAAMDAAAAAAPQTVESYNLAMKFFHWATAAGIVTCVGTVQYAMNIKDKKQKAQAMMIHKSTGLLVACLVIPRLATRLLSKIPAHHPETLQLERYAADAAHYLLYGMMFAMPASGIAMGYYGGKGLPFFGTTIPGAAESKPEVAKNAFKAHKKIGVAMEVMLSGHVGAVGLHAIRGQNVLGRMAAIFASK